MLLSALGGVLLFTSNDDRTEVLVAAADLEPGQPLERSDLRIQRVALDGGVASMARRRPPSWSAGSPSARSRRGRCWHRACSPTTPRSAPTRWSSAPPSTPARRRCRGCRSARPSSCSTSTPPARRGAPADGDRRRDRDSIGTGTVWAVEPIATGQLWVSMRVAREVGLTASLAAAQDTLRVVLVGAAG